MGWIIALFAPDRTVADHICLMKNTAVSTSGDYEQYILVDGEKIGHIVDPRTGRPVHREYAVSAIAPSALRADILSTVFYLDPRYCLFRMQNSQLQRWNRRIRLQLKIGSNLHPIREKSRRYLKKLRKISGKGFKIWDTVLPEGEKWAGIRIIRNESADVRNARGRR
jgi:hypothetical protein